MSGDLAKKPSILGLCNPLLDISAYVDQDLLEKYKLEANNVILAGQEHKDLCNELVERYPVDYTAGGSAQNVMRVAASILRRQNVDCKVIFAGCVGDDKNGSVMKNKAQEDGVVTSYAIATSEPTGTCAVCLTEGGKNRSLCAFLGASQKFTDEHLTKNWKDLVENTDIVYMSGFLIAVSPKSFHLLGEHIAKSDNPKKVFCLNLSAPYVSQVFGKEIEQMIKYVDILFCNDDEANAFASHKQWDTTDLDAIATKLALDDKIRTSVKRLVIITRGGDPIITAQLKGEDSTQVEIKKFDCQTIPSQEIVDTNGAGDSFAGGFLSQFIQGASLDTCIKMGDYAAREIIKISGVVMPSFSNIPEI